MQEDTGDSHPRGRSDLAQGTASRGSWQTPRRLATHLDEHEQRYQDACRARDDAIRRSEALASYLQQARDALVEAHEQLHDRDASFRELVALMLDRIHSLEADTSPEIATSTGLANAPEPATRVIGLGPRLREMFKRIGKPRSTTLGHRDGS